MGLFYGAFQLTDWLTNWVTSVMEQSSFWYANSFLAPQVIPRLLWNLTFVTMFLRTHHRNLSWARLIHFTSFKPSPLRSVYEFSHWRRDNPSFLFPSSSVTKSMYPFLNSWMSLRFEVGGPRSSPGQVKWDLLCTQWHWGRFSPSTSVSPANSHFTDCPTFIIIYHPGLVQ
jgi:hypothetical protein